MPRTQVFVEVVSMFVSLSDCNANRDSNWA